MSSDYTWVAEGLKYFRPESILVCSIVLLVVLSAVKSLNKDLLVLVTLVLLAACGYVAFSDLSEFSYAQSLFKGAIEFDKFALFFKLFFIAVAFITAIFSFPLISRWNSGFPEFFVLLLSCTLGMILMAESRNFLMMFLNLEFVSITSYIMAGLSRHDRKSIEASLKYIIYGAGSSGIMLFGMSFLYGATGSIDVYEVGNMLASVNLSSTVYLVVSVLILAGFAYKMALAPFHMWCPDVYEGSPTPITAFFSTAPKIAGFAMMIRFADGVFGKVESPFEWKLIFFVLAILSMIFGNLAALHQTNLKRLMAYSGIAHAGYMALIFLSFNASSIGALLFYSLVYTVMNLGAFMIIIIMEKYYGVETIDDCSGFGRDYPVFAVPMALFMFSLVGLPPLAGFFGKLVVFMYPIEQMNLLGILAVTMAVIFSVISLFYYARVVAAMFLRQSSSPLPPKESVSPALIIPTTLFAAAIALLIFFDWDTIYEFCRNCSL